MKIACCTTSINVPRVIEAYQACDVGAKWYVAIDKKTPTEALGYLTKRRAAIIDAGDEWKCSALLSWNSLSRRNLAFLAALRDGAEVIVSIDDDNSPVSTDYFWQIETKIFRRFNGLCGACKSGWYDAGQLLVPWARHRGIPYGHHKPVYRSVTDARIGVMAGLVLGDSDVDATTRIENQPYTQVVSELARSGVVVDLNTHTTFNSQNSAVIRELVPAWFLMPGVGRMDDIYASLVVQRVAKERGLHVRFGEPFAYQERNPHDLVEDLRAEIDGYEFVRPMAELLDAIVLPGKSVIADTSIIYEKLRHASWIPERAVEAALAWLEDVESVL